MTTTVSYELKENLGLVRINNPPVNALSQVVRQGIVDAIREAQADASEAVLLVCEGRTFVAGADITEFGKPPLDPWLPEVLVAIENATKPVVAAIHGTALGGGLELALACHYRCAIASARVGLPEVKLGLLPGAGGTQRVPRVAGVKAALELIASGNPISVTKAQSMGLVDKIIPGDDLLSGAMAYARDLLNSGASLRRIRDITMDPAAVEPGFFDAARKQLARRARGQITGDRIVSCLEAAVTLPMDQGLAREQELFRELMQSPESEAMRHVFFAQRQAARIRDLPKDTPTRAIRKVAIIGGGTMGGGIAMCFINVGIPVVLLEIDDESLQRGLGIVQKNYRISVRKGRLTEAKVAERMALLSGTTDYSAVGDVDLVIEAVFENLELKQEIFAKLDAVCKPGAILATNTSYQNVDVIAAATGRPQDVLGMHFFSPANVMKLLEVVRGENTAADVLATAMHIGKKIGKVSVLARVCYGFIGNRMLEGYSRESQMLLLDGCTPEQVDSALEGFGMAMGPLAMGDLAGLDVMYRARQARTDRPDDPRLFRIGTLLAEMGRYGQKTGSGFYQYDAETRQRVSDPEVEALIRTQAEDLHIRQMGVSKEEILARCLYPLVNEGAKILAEGIAQRSSDIDIVYVYGYAFPVARGGPMHYADQVGLDKVYERICEFRDRYGAQYWQPAPLLEQLAKAGKSFAQWDRERGAA